MDSFDSRNLRRILKIRWQDKVRTSSVREKIGQCPLNIILQKRRLTWYAQLTRIKTERLPKQGMNWKLPGKRGHGRPQTTWKQTISRDLQRPRHVIRGGRSCSTGPDRMTEETVRLYAPLGTKRYKYK